MELVLFGLASRVVALKGGNPVFPQNLPQVVLSLLILSKA